MRERIASGLAPVAYLLAAACLLVWYVGQPAGDQGAAAAELCVRRTASAVPWDASA